MPAPAIYLSATGLVIFCLLGAFVSFSGTRSMDHTAFDVIAPHISSARTNFMMDITFFGNHKFLVPANLLFLAFLLIKKQRAWALLLVFSSLGGLLLELLVKQLVHRVRPDNPVITGGVNGLSFPSGHALMCVAFYGMLIYYGYNRFADRWQRISITVLLAALIIVISFSRIYLRVHYLSDVLAGLSIGFTWLVVSRWLVEKFRFEQPALKRV